MTADILVYAAGAVQAFGFLITDQLRLRIVTLVGTFLYMLYYATVAETPLWGALLASAAIGVANGVGMLQLILRDHKWRVPRQHMDLLPLFGQIPVGDFRTLTRLGNRRRIPKRELFTREGQPNPRLVYLISGSAEITKQDTSFTVTGPCFLGEVGFLRQSPPRATTHLCPGAEIMAWEASELQTAGHRDSRLGLSLRAMISDDMASKVTNSVAAMPPQRQQAG